MTLNEEYRIIQNDKVMTQTLSSKLFRAEVLAMSAYKVADAKNLIKLDAMENPYTWSEEIKQEWLEVIKDCPINRYPDPEAKQLTEIIRHHNQIPAENPILLGNGSDEIIQLLLMALAPESCVLATSPSFVMYRQVALSLGLHYQDVALKAEDFSLDMKMMMQAIKTHQPAIIFLAYPNNPTGNLFNPNDIKHILDHAPGLVILDEAYAPFANTSFMDSLKDYDNLLVMRTVSKLGLAGLRLGFITGQQDIIEQLNKIRLPYNINSLTQLTAKFALEKAELFEAQTDQIIADREVLANQLNKIDGIHPYPSEANFILFKTLSKSADDIFNQLKKRGILIKNLSPQSGVLKDCLRVTIGTSEENLTFIRELSSIMQDSP